MALYSDLISASGGAYFYDLQDGPGIVVAATSGKTVSASGPAAAGRGYRVVTLAEPFDRSFRSLLFPGWFVGAPVVGDTIRYDTAQGFEVLSSGLMEVLDPLPFTTTYYYNDGTGEIARTLTIDGNTYAVAEGEVVVASGPAASAFSGTPATATTAGKTVAASGPTAQGIGAGAGSTSGSAGVASGPSAAGSGGGAGSTSGATVEAAGPGASANGGESTIATTGGKTVSASGPTAIGAASGTAQSVGAEVEVSGPTSTGRGEAIGSTPGSRVDASGPTATAAVPAAATTSGDEVVVSGPSAAGSGAATGQSTGGSVSAGGPTAAASGAALGATSGKTVDAEGPSATPIVPAVGQTTGATVVAAGPGASGEGSTVASVEGATLDIEGPAAGIEAGAVAALTGTRVAIVSSKVSAGEILVAVYARRQDMEARFGATEILQLTDRENTGEVDETVLSGALSDADAEIDAYLEGRYRLPLPEVPRILRAYACDIARYRLYDDRASEAVTKRYNDAVKFLQRLAERKVTLGLAQAETQNEPVGGPTCAAPARVFTETTLKDFL